MILKVDDSNLIPAAEIHSKSWQQSHKSFCDPAFIQEHTPERQAAYIREALAGGKTFYMLVDDQPVGIVSVCGSRIEDLYILPGRQRRGYGTKLLQYAMQQCQDTPTLWILSNNQAAYSLYSRHGFIKTGKQRQLSGTIYELEMKHISAAQTGMVPMTEAYAGQISAWTYPDEYAVYSFVPNRDTISELMNGEYYAYLTADDTLAGYFCYGQSARIPAAEADAYTGDALDIGLGMNPGLCGQGYGAAFVQAGLDFTKTAFAPEAIRLTVAVFNRRAIRTYEKLGFRHTKTITHSKSQKPFHIMTYSC